MIDKVQKIREEVKRLMYGFNLEADIASCEDAETEKLADIKYLLCKKILDYIDNVQKEHIFKVGDTIQKKDDNSIRYSIINKTSDGYRALRGLSDTIVIWFSEQDQWELVEEPVSDDLNEAAIAYNKKVNFIVAGNIPNEHFVAGAEWKKEQMMKDVIEGEVITTSDYGWENIRVYKKEHHCGQKLKVIVIKED